MNVADALEGLMKKARTDETLKKELLDTQGQPDALLLFCALSTEAGFPMDAMELIAYGEESYASIKRSTNGGGENSPMLDWEDDYYEMFLAQLRDL